MPRQPRPADSMNLVPAVGSVRRGDSSGGAESDGGGSGSGSSGEIVVHAPVSPVRKAPLEPVGSFQR